MKLTKKNLVLELKKMCVDVDGVLVRLLSDAGLLIFLIKTVWTIDTAQDTLGII